MNSFEVRLDAKILAKAVSLEGWISFLMEQRWFSGKGREISSVRPFATCAIDSALVIAVLRVSYLEGEDEDYILPLLVGTTEQGPGIGLLDGRPLLDALVHEDGWRRLLEAFGRSQHTGQGLDLQVEVVGAALARRGDVRIGSADQTNSWAIVGDLFVKVFRRLQPGENLDVEVGRFLTRRGGTRTPALRGVLTAEGVFGQATLLSVQDALRAKGTGWDLACAQVAAQVRGQTADFSFWSHLGTAMADLHKVLASDGPDAIGTLPLRTPDLQDAARGAMVMARQVLADAFASVLTPAASGLSQVLRVRQGALMKRIKAPVIESGSCHRQRIHGDIHLGQVLWDGSEFCIIDFEGEPARPPEERRRKQSPARDVAGMLRSFDYAARAGLPEGTGKAGEQSANAWRNEARKAFLDAYETAIGNEPFLPSNPVLRAQLIDLYELEKAFYELKYELSHRPEWVEIPMAGLLDLVSPRRAH